MKNRIALPIVGILAVALFQALEIRVADAGQIAATHDIATAPPGEARPTFTPLPFGDITPHGWILAQMKRDLATGFAGHLDELCREASSDIFASGRNRPGKPNRGNRAGSAWWNGETEGNWHCGYLMLACLTQDPVAMKKAKAYVEHILASQDADGYIGIYSPSLRYRGNGELWTQTCLFRGLLAYAEATGNEKVYAAVKQAVDRTIAGYAARKKIHFTQHDVMFTDVLAHLFSRTGDRKYLDFGERLIHECPNLKEFLREPEISNHWNMCYWGGHGATDTEVMRIPFWLWRATGNKDDLKDGLRDIAAMNRFCMPSGMLVSEESVDRRPNPWHVGCEYCTIFEREFTLIKAGETTGDAADFQNVEQVWFNAAQGSREPDDSAILYCSDENRLSVHDEHGRRERFSPTHQQVAVCCCPNSTRVAPYFISSAWMKPAGHEPALAAVLYGPCEVKTEVGGIHVQIDEKTEYPYAGKIELRVAPRKPARFCLWLRNPAWSQKTQVACAGAQIQRAGDFWQLRKEWKAGDTVTIHFDETIRAVPAINGEVALQYGPLLYVLPVKGEKETVKTYKNSDLKDYYVIMNTNDVTNLSLPGEKRNDGFGFSPKSVAGTNPGFPLDQPPVVLQGAMLRKDSSPMFVTLVPMGAKSAELRRVTFAVGKP